MAPRPRSRRGAGSQRIDAAFDALIPMGFSKEVVKKTITELLKIYGNDGWVFLEEAGYKVVIDTMLEEQKEEANVEEGGGENADDARALEFSGQTSSSPREAIAGLHSGVGELVLISGDEDMGGGEGDLPVITEDAGLSIEHEQSPMLPGLGVVEDTRPRIISPVTSSNFNCQQQSTTEVARQRRAPCHGWISESEDEEEYPPVHIDLIA